MSQAFTICVGTVGAGVWFSPDCGDHWRRSKMKLPFHAEPGELQIRSLAVSPRDPHHLLAGSEAGLYRSEDNGASWDLVDSPMDGQQIWSTAWHPLDPDVLFAGTKAPNVYRSQDRGVSWQKLNVPMAKECFAGAPKVTNIVVDSADPRTVFVGVEIDGIFRSRDGGDSWLRLPPLGDKMLNQDIHGVARGVGPAPKLYATTPDGIWTSRDDGESWSLHGFPKFAERDTISYCRGMALKPDDPDVIFVGNGDFIPGKRGTIQHTTDGGVTWNACRLPVEANSVVYWIATHPSNPDVVVASSIHGYVYTSLDAGATWSKNRREFGEIRAISWMPN
ncbi:MAG: VPS10 domain-containing protein [Candidatus Binataceae bacterium]